MIGTVLIAVLILAIGARAGDGIRLRQQELILAKLRPAEATSYFKVLRRRAWTVRVLRGIALISLVAILYARNQAWKIAAVRTSGPARSPQSLPVPVPPPSEGRPPPATGDGH